MWTEKFEIFRHKFRMHCSDLMETAFTTQFYWNDVAQMHVLPGVDVDAGEWQQFVFIFLHLYRMRIEASV